MDRTEAAARPSAADVRNDLTAAGSALPALPWPRLGQGVWGDVFLLTDGTLLKCVRLEGGAGHGERKRQAEALMLAALPRLKSPEVLAPTLLGEDVWPEGGSLSAIYCGWLRLSRLRGTVLSTAEMGKAPLSEQRARGDKLGRTLARLHLGGGRLLAEAATLGDPILRGLYEVRPLLDKAEDAQRLGALAKAWQRRADAAVLLHGDVNLSNIVWPPEPKAPLGLIDWAEAGVGARESEFRHFAQSGAQPLGAFRDGLFAGYEAVLPLPLDPRRLVQVAAANAFATLALGGEDDGSFEARHRRRVLEQSLAQLDLYPG